MLVDDKKSRRIVVQKIFDAAVVASVTVSGVNLFHTLSDHTALLDSRRIMWQIEYRRIVVFITDLYPVQCQTEQQ